MPDDYQPTQFEQVLDRDMELVFQAPLGAGISVTLVTEDGSTHELRAMFATPGAEPLSGVASAPVVSVAPTLHVLESDVQAALGRPLSGRDRVIVRGRAYRVLNPQDDGYGLLECRLLEAAHV